MDACNLDFWQCLLNLFLSELVNTIVQLVDYMCKIFIKFTPVKKMQGDKNLSSLPGFPLCDSDIEEDIEGKNLNKHINQCAFLAQWNLFYQLPCWCSQIFWWLIRRYWLLDNSTLLPITIPYKIHRKWSWKKTMYSWTCIKQHCIKWSPYITWSVVKSLDEFFS